MFKYSITLLLICNSFFILKAQDIKDDKGVKWKVKMSKCILGMGFIYQNEFIYQVGPKINLIKKAENFSIIPSLQIQKHGVYYLSPSLLIRYYKPIKKYIGPTLAIEANMIKVNNINYTTITPEIGINFNGACSIGYGYNFSLTQKPDWIWNNRIVLRLMLL